MYSNRELGIKLPPNFFPFIQEIDKDWLPRYAIYNPPGEYHNGGIWPFVCGFYIAALVAAGRHKLAEVKLLELTDLVTRARENQVEYGFNEWHRSRDGNPMGQDWQTWSAAMYLYAAACVREKETPFFSRIRKFKNQPGH
jgi:glycogen debranching enzyme